MAVVVARLITHVAGGVEGLYIEGGVVGEGGEQVIPVGV